MTEQIDCTGRILSHQTAEYDLEKAIDDIRDRIHSRGNLPYASVETQLDILHQLSESELGKFLIINKGLNGYWTHVILTHPIERRASNLSISGKPLTTIEQFLFNAAPIVRATQQRSVIFHEATQQYVKNGATLASIPCGLMGELLYLDYSGINDITLIGIDADLQAIKQAMELAEQRHLSDYIRCYQNDAWQLQDTSTYDVVVSNGLSIYEQDDDKVISLYNVFRRALKSGGSLITSAATPPPGSTQPCEWDMSEIVQDDLLLQRIILSDILHIKWQCFRTVERTKDMLAKAGFVNIDVRYDRAKLFPTFIAHL